MSRTFVIAEAAATHDGSLEKALRLIDLARVIRADAVKFQWLSSPERLAQRRNAPEYLSVYRMLAFPREWFHALVDRCSDERIEWDGEACVEVPPVEFICTVFLPEDIAVVAPYVKRFKVASFEAGDAHFLGLHAEFRKQVIVSAGMQDAGAMRSAVCRYVGLLDVPPPSWSSAIALLHCVSAYPCPDDEINLGVLRQNVWNAAAARFSGLSDHTPHPWTGALAVAAGAEIVELHMRLDDTDPGNADYAVSRSPAEAREYVANIRTAEVMLGDGVKCVMPCEEPMLKYRVRP